MDQLPWRPPPPVGADRLPGVVADQRESGPEQYLSEYREGCDDSDTRTGPESEKRHSGDC